MDWNITWIIIGSISFMMAIVNLIRVAFFKKFSILLMFCSLSLGALTILEEYRVASSWLEYGNMVLLQSMPNLMVILSNGLWILIIINLLILVMARKMKILL